MTGTLSLSQHLPRTIASIEDFLLLNKLESNSILKGWIIFPLPGTKILAVFGDRTRKKCWACASGSLLGDPRRCGGG